MTSSPPPPDPASRRPLGFDDFIGILVAFLVIGTILFWSLSRREQVDILGLAPLAAPQPSAPPDSVVDSAEQAPTGLLAPAPVAPIEPEADLETFEVEPTPVPTATPERVGAGYVAPVPTATSAPAIPQAPSFSDVPPDFWAFPFIQVLSQRGVISGFEDGTFQPDEPITRAQFAAMLQTAFEQNPDQREVVEFVDVPDGFWAVPAIDKAYRIGFLEGYPGNVFQPEQRIPRVQALAALARGLNLTTPADAPGTLQTFQDAEQIPDYATAKVAAAAEAGLVVNYPNLQTLEPNREATRAEIAAILYQALVAADQVEPINSQYVVQP